MKEFKKKAYDFIQSAIFGAIVILGSYLIILFVLNANGSFPVLNLENHLNYEDIKDLKTINDDKLSVNIIIIITVIGFLSWIYFLIRDIIGKEIIIKKSSIRRNKNKNKDTVFNFLIHTPTELQTAFQQYLLFFNDYIRLAKNKTVNLEVSRNENGLDIKIDLEKQSNLVEIKEYLFEYINFIKQEIEKIEIFVYPEISQKEFELLILELRNQIKSLQASLEINKLLKINSIYNQSTILKEAFKELIDRDNARILTDTNSIKKSDFHINSIFKKDEASIEAIYEKYKSKYQTIPNSFFEELERLMKSGKIDEVIKLLLEEIEDFNLRKDLLVLKNQLNKLQSSEKLNLLGFSETQIWFSKINNGLLMIINSLKKI